MHELTYSVDTEQINQGIKEGESQGYISICNTIATGVPKEL